MSKVMAMAVPLASFLATSILSSSPAVGDVKTDTDASLVDATATKNVPTKVIQELTGGANGAADDATYTMEIACSLPGEHVCPGNVECQDGEGMIYDIYRNGGYWRQTCITPSDFEPGRVTPALVESEYQKLAWPASQLIVQPSKGFNFVNRASIFYTDNASPTTQVVRLLGQRITIEATPIEYIWAFGDDSSLSTTSPGRPYPSFEITHTYLRKGIYAPSVATVYQGRYRVGNGAWQRIPATLTVAGPSASIEIRTARPTLVS